MISSMDHVVNTRDENGSILCDQFPQEGDEGSHGFVHGSAKNTRVEVAGWAGDFNEHIRQTAEPIGDTRSTGVEPVVVGLKADSVNGSVPLRKSTYNTDGVDAVEPAILPFGMLDSDEFIKADTSTLLHAFEDETEIHREFNPQIFMGLKDVEPTQDGTLIVRGTTSNELAVIGDGQSERIGVPSVTLNGLDSKGSVPLSQNSSTSTVLTGWTSK